MVVMRRTLSKDDWWCLDLELQARLARFDAVDRQHERLQQRALGIRFVKPHHAVHRGAFRRGTFDRMGLDVHGRWSVHLADFLGAEVGFDREPGPQELEGQG